jgi:tryptophanyl-tRNA synthetase
MANSQVYFFCQIMQTIIFAPMKQIVVSGIRSTGKLHLGNYFGAIVNFLKMQEQNNCYFFIADWHSLTTHPTPADLRSSVRNVLVEYLACGIDPNVATLYIQSDIPEIAELYLYLNMLAYKGELERVTTFKDKAKTQPDNINAGLLTYPVLMAADIIIHRAAYVPVGKDQEQHLEMARTFANRFNNLYEAQHYKPGLYKELIERKMLTPFFPEPQAYNFGNELVKVPGLDGKGKMSKSNGEHTSIFLQDTRDEIIKKMKRSVTDSGPTEPNQAKPEPIQNLFDLMKLVSKPETYAHFDNLYNTCTIRYGDFKMQIAEDMDAFVAPIREKMEAIRNDDTYIANALKTGTEKARESAQATIKEVRRLIGFGKFY